MVLDLFAFTPGDRRLVTAGRPTSVANAVDGACLWRAPPRRRQPKSPSTRPNGLNLGHPRPAADAADTPPRPTDTQATSGIMSRMSHDRAPLQVEARLDALF